MMAGLRIGEGWDTHALVTGRPLVPRTWLKLPVGRHRVSILAPGRERQDVLVEVSPGAEKVREVLVVNLLPGG